jgi:hypothetical protein
MSYGTDLADTYHQTAIYTGKILIGAKPGRSPGPTGSETRACH